MCKLECFYIYLSYFFQLIVLERKDNWLIIETRRNPCYRENRMFTSGCALDDGLVLRPAAFAGAWASCPLRARLLQSVNCAGYGGIPIIMHLVEVSVLVKKCSGLWPSPQPLPGPLHGHLLSSPFYCRMSGTNYDWGMLGPAALAGDWALGLPCTLSLYSCTMRACSCFRPPLRLGLWPSYGSIVSISVHCNKSGTVYNEGKLGPWLSHVSILSTPVQL